MTSIQKKRDLFTIETQLLMIVNLFKMYNQCNVFLVV